MLRRRTNQSSQKEVSAPLQVPSQDDVPCVKLELSLLEECVDSGIPFTQWVGVDHTLKADVFI